jgi:hypothetical protein
MVVQVKRVSSASPESYGKLGFQMGSFQMGSF